jgi:adenine phosphoribosyltransferase
MNDEHAAIAGLRAKIRDVPDFPKKGVVFKDITTLLGDAKGLKEVSELLAAECWPLKLDKVVAIESRGFIFGGMLADRLGCGFVPVRKPGKLPRATLRASYKLEYGEDVLEIHEDALRKGERAVIVDDVIATGGTARAVGDLVARTGATVAAYAFVIELTFLNGRELLGAGPVVSLIRY